jgi:hypothetical protein
MKLTVLTLTALLSISPVCGQRTQGRLGNGSHAGPTLNLRSLRTHAARSVTPQASGAPAPGVVVVSQDLLTGAAKAYFVATQTLPSGAVISGAITLLDDNSTIDFTGFILPQDFAPGQAVFLPSFSDFGDVFGAAGALLAYSVTVQAGKGNATQVDGIVSLFEPLKFSDFAGAAQPVITSVTQTVNGAKDVILQITGTFSGANPTTVVLSDLNFLFTGSYIVPGTAMTVSNSEIDVNLSKIAGLACDPVNGTNCLGFVDDMLVTVNQGFSSGGVSETAPFRYAPGPAGTFNPAPNAP